MNKHYKELLKSNDKVFSFIEETIRLAWNKTNFEYVKLFNENYKIEKIIDININESYLKKRKYLKTYYKNIKNKQKSKINIPDEFLSNFQTILSDSFYDKNIKYDDFYLKNYNSFSSIKITNILSDNNLIFDLTFSISPEIDSIYLSNISFYNKSSNFFVRYSFSTFDTNITLSPSGYFLVDDKFISLNFDYHKNNFEIALSRMYSENLFLPISSDYNSVLNDFDDNYKKFFQLLEKIKNVDIAFLQEMLLNPNFEVPIEIKDFLLLTCDVNFSEEDSDLISIFSHFFINHQELKINTKNNFIDKILNVKNKFK